MTAPQALRYAQALATLHGYTGRRSAPLDDAGVVTHRDVVDLLPDRIRNDFLPPAEQDYDYVCSYHPNGGFLVPHGEIKRLDQYA